MLNVTELSKRYAGRTLFEGVAFRLEPGEKAALVGVNGSGKSTLLRILAGQVASDAGEVTRPRGTRVGYLPQETQDVPDRPLAEELQSVFVDLDHHRRQWEALGGRLAEMDPADPEYAAVADRYGRLQHEIDRLDAHDVPARVGRVAAGLGFSSEDLGRSCAEFSGGWRMRIPLAKLLLLDPDVLLLDEPTNHLDLETLIWLENWLRGSSATVLLVSHERRFMDALVGRVFEIHAGRFTLYRGNYSDYLQSRAERWAQWRREYDNQQEEIARIQRFVDRFRYNASKARLVQSRLKSLERIEPVPPPPQESPAIRFRFPPPDRGPKEVFLAQGLVKAYGSIPVLREVDLMLWRGEKVALVGVNGAGKSTLLRLLGGEENPTAGRLQRGANVRTEFFAQYDHDGMDPTNSVWREMAAVAPAGQMEKARDVLGGFFFTGEDVEKPVGVLSGGERTRLRLARMLFSGANVLLLDEPTNHLDIASRAALERALGDYAGTVVFVSHDRAFLNAVATRVVEIKDGRLRSFPGNYEDYCRALRSLGETSPLVESPSNAASARSLRSPRAAASRRDASRSHPPSGPPGELRRAALKESAREQQRLRKLVAQLENEIAAVEARLAEIEAELAEPEVYRNHLRCGPLLRERERLREHHGAYLLQWEKQAGALEKLRSPA